MLDITASSLHIEPTEEHAKCFAGTVHAVMRDSQFLVLSPILGDLLEVRGAWQEEDNVSRSSRERFVECFHRVGLHHVEIEDFVVGVSGTYRSSVG